MAAPEEEHSTVIKRISTDVLRMNVSIGPFSASYLFAEPFIQYFNSFLSNLLKSTSVYEAHHGPNGKEGEDATAAEGQ
jgi:hypothetical protein